MVAKNPALSQLGGSYLFTHIEEKKKQFLKETPDAQLMNLGIGDTTLPIPEMVTDAMADAAKSLSDQKRYTGYGPGAGHQQLREQIARVIYQDLCTGDEVFVSDGSKCDIGRLQVLLGSKVKVAVQDPTYPVYRDGTLLMGTEHPIVKMPCTPDNQFFPDLTKLPQVDVIYFCSPNNPTGAAATRQQLEELVDYARNHKILIIFDTAYASFIRDDTLPKTIYEIKGADKVAIETGSFSKCAGFTGVRLGWTVVPKKLIYQDGSSLRDSWLRTISTIYNGPSNIVQAGGLAALTPEGQRSIRSLIQTYMASADELSAACRALGYEVYGGENAPYLWVRMPGKSSWESFDELLEKSRIISTPGIGFGDSGEGFIRFSAFAPFEQIREAIKRLKHLRAHTRDEPRLTPVP